MTRAVTLAVIAVAVASAAAQVPQRDWPRTRPSGDSSITGIIVSDEAEPRPLRRAHVTLQGPALPGSELTTTADDGTFTFAKLPAGRYSVSAAKSAYVSMNYGARAPLRPGAQLTLDAGETKTITIRLPRGAVITGVLTNPDGQPAPGLSVTAFRYRYFSGGQSRLLPDGAASTTDENGVYRVYGLAAGEYVIGTQMRQTAAVLSTVSPDQVRAAVIEARSTAINDRRIPSTLTPTESIAPKANLVVAPVYYPGTVMTSQAAPVTVAKGQERSGVDFQVPLVAAATVSGSLPLTVPRPFVSLRRREEPVPPLTDMRTTGIDPFGRFSFSAIVPGRYTVSALVIGRASGSGTDIQWATTDITVDGEDVSVGLSLQPALTIAGRVVFEGEYQPMPPTRLPLPIVSPIPGAPTPFVQLDSEGRFVISGIVAGQHRLGEMPGIRSRIGSWWLKSITLGGRELLDGPIDLQKEASDAVVTFSNRASELSGRVMSPIPGEQPSAFVVVFTTDRNAWFHNSRRVAGVRAGADGRYAISNLPPGDYFAVVDDNVDPNEWFDPAVLDRLAPRAVRITLGADETRTHDFVIK